MSTNAKTKKTAKKVVKETKPEINTKVDNNAEAEEKEFSAETLEKFELIIYCIAEQGKSLRSALLENKMGWNLFYKMLQIKEYQQQYAYACEIRADKIFDEIIEISDNPVDGVVLETDDNGRTKEKKGDMLGHRRLQVDARKWALSKMNPKKYGDKIQNDISISDENREKLMTLFPQPEDLK